MTQEPNCQRPQTSQPSHLPVYLIRFLLRASTLPIRRQSPSRLGTLGRLFFVLSFFFLFFTASELALSLTFLSSSNTKASDHSIEYTNLNLHAGTSRTYLYDVDSQYIHYYSPTYYAMTMAALVSSK